MPPIGSTPTFSYHGSKATIARWVISYFPKTIRYYAEPFAGRANILFRGLGDKLFTASRFFLNDIKTAAWFEAVRDYKGDYSFIPPYVNEPVFKEWLARPDSIERRLVEPIVCYHSNCWNIGSASNSEPGSHFYSDNFQKNWERKIRLAQKILSTHPVEITSLDFLDFLQSKNWTSDDLIYFDPPYLADYDEKKTYPNIDHRLFLDIATQIKTRIVISNYENSLYESVLLPLGWNCYKKERVSYAKGRQKGHSNNRTTKTEVLWTNY